MGRGESSGGERERLNNSIAQAVVLGAGGMQGGRRRTGGAAGGGGCCSVVLASIVSAVDETAWGEEGAAGVERTKPGCEASWRARDIRPGVCVGLGLIEGRETIPVLR